MSLTLAIESKVQRLGDSPSGVSIFANVRTIAELREIITTFLETGTIVTLGGYYAQNDGGGGQFVFDATSAAADDGGLTIAPTTGVGRWIRQRASISTFDARWFGMSPSATAAQNSTAFNAAVAAAPQFAAGNFGMTLEIPGGQYDVNALLITPASGRYSLNIIGKGGTTVVVLNYKGAGGTCLTINNNVYFTLQDIQIQNGATGDTGLLIQSIAPGGAATGPVNCRNVVITGFTTGLHIGSADNKAADVLKFFNLNVAQATTGILIEGIDGITIGFENLTGNNCTTFLHFVGNVGYNKSCIRIFGGGVVNNNTEFLLDNPLHLTVINWYSEGSVAGARFLDVPMNPIAGLVTYVNVINCEFFQSAGTTARLYGAGFYSFRNFHHDGNLDVGSTHNGDRYHVSVEQCEGCAVVYYTPGGGLAAVSVRAFQNANNFTNNQSVVDDEIYVYVSGGTKKSLWKYAWSDYANLANITPVGALAGMVSILTVNSATPSVSGNNLWITLNTAPTTITFFNNGYDGQRVTIKIADANTTFDFTGTNLKGNAGVDYVANSGDWIDAVYYQGLWLCAVHKSS